MIKQTQTNINRLLGIKGLYADSVEPDAKLVPNTNYEALLMFLQSKDDNLLLQIGGLLLAIISSELDQETQEKLVVLYSGPPTESKLTRIKNRDELLSACAEILMMSPFFRNFTVRLYQKILNSLDPKYRLSSKQHKAAQEALNGIVELLISHLRNSPAEVGIQFGEEIMQ